MSAPRERILLIGGGRMGGALARGWAGRWDVLVHDPHAAPINGTSVVAELATPVPAGIAAVLVAVKPGVVANLLPDLRRFAEAGAVIVSVAAGCRLAMFAAALGGGAQIVRAMPNTPAAVGRGITALVAADGTGVAARAQAERLMSAVGEVLWLSDEAQLDLVTAVSGSGPAYVFRFAEALAVAGVAAGLPPAIAMRLARATLSGSAALVTSRSDHGLADLRAEVTSPGGTTAAALARLDPLDALLTDAVSAAVARSRELGA